MWVYHYLVCPSGHWDMLMMFRTTISLSTVSVVVVSSIYSTDSVVMVPIIWLYIIIFNRLLPPSDNSISVNNNNNNNNYYYYYYLYIPLLQFQLGEHTSCIYDIVFLKMNIKCSKHVGGKKLN